MLRIGVVLNTFEIPLPQYEETNEGASENETCDDIWCRVRPKKLGYHGTIGNSQDVAHLLGAISPSLNTKMIRTRPTVIRMAPSQSTR